MKVRLLLAAELEFDDATQWYEEQQAGLGHEFREAVWDAIRLVQRSPELGQMITENARQKVVRKFAYGVVYSIEHDHVLVVSIKHLHRDDQYWQSRLTEPRP